MNRIFPNNKILLAAVAAALSVDIPEGHSATATYQGTTGTSSGSRTPWSTTGNWTGTPPTNNATLDFVFAPSAYNYSNNDLTGLTANSITFNGGTNDNDITGNAITLAGNVTDNTGNYQRLRFNMDMGSTTRDFAINSGQLEVYGVLSGNAGLTKSGGATLVLDSYNTYTGGTTVNNGTLQLNKGGGTGAIGGLVTVNSGGTIRTTNDSFGYNNGSLRVTTLNIAGGTVTHTQGNNLTLASMAINMTGGTLQNTDSNGQLVIYNNGAGKTAINTLASGTTATIAGKVNLSNGGNTTTAFTVADGAAADDLLVSANVIEGNGGSGIQKLGAGRMVLSGTNSYTGGTTLEAGTLVAASKTALGSNNSTVKFNAGSGSTLELATSDGTLTNSYNLDMGSNRFNTIVLNRATSGDVSYAFGTFTLGSSTMTFTKGANIATSASVTIGTLDLSGGNDDRPVTLNGDATINIGNAGIFTNSTAPQNGSNFKRLQLDGSATDNTIGAITNGNGTMALALIKDGSSTWTLNGTNTYTGTTTVNNGTLKAGSTQAFGSNSAVTMANTAGAVLDLNNNNNSIGSLSGGGTTGGNVTLGSATLTVGGDNTSLAAFAGVISGTGALTKTGTGKLILNSTNTFTGGTTINNGTLELAKGGAAGAIQGTVTVNTGATLLSTAGDSLGYNIGTKVNTLEIAGGTVTHNSGGNLTISSATINMTGGTLQSIGSGGLDIYNKDNSGQTTINTLASANTATIAGKIGLRSGDSTSSPDTVFTVADGAAAIDLEVTAVVANGQYNSANSSIQKSGTGWMRLTGSNTYNGKTTVNSGTLELAGTSGSAAGGTSSIIVKSTGTLLLSNNNQISDSATVSLGGGTIKFGAAVTEGSTSTVGVGALTLTASSTIDFSSFASTVTFSSFTPSSFTLNVTNWTPSSSHLIFNADQSSNLSSFTVNSLAASQIDLGGGFYEITAVPEPGTIVGGIALLGCVGLVERKRIGRVLGSSSSRRIC